MAKFQNKCCFKSLKKSGNLEFQNKAVLRREVEGLGNKDDTRAQTLDLVIEVITVPFFEEFKL